MHSISDYDKCYDNDVTIKVYDKDKLLLSSSSKVREISSNVAYLLYLGYSFEIVNV